MNGCNQKPLVVAMTGASGSVYGLRFVKAVTELGWPVTLTLSRAAGIVIREELGIEIDVDCRGEVASPYDQRAGKPRPYGLEKLFDAKTLSFVTYYPEHDLSAPIASGSYPTHGMIVIPSSTNTFAKIANGISDGLIERAAECTIKEGRKLVIVPRETPMSAIHLENLLKLARLGVSVVPAIPGFYSGAQKIEELVDFVIGKALDQLGITHALYQRWTGTGARGGLWAANWL